MMKLAERRDTLVDMIQAINPDLFVVTLTVMSVSTATPERSFSTMRDLQNYLCSTMATEHMSRMVLMHVHKDTELDAERITHQFSRQKNRRLAILFRPE